MNNLLFANVSFSNGVEYSLWDRWEVHGNRNFTIKQFIQTLQVTGLLNTVGYPQLTYLTGNISK